MKVLADRPGLRALSTDLRAIFVSMELSLIGLADHICVTGGGEKMSKHAVAAGNIAGLLEWLAQLKGESARPDRQRLSDHHHRRPGSMAFGSTGCCRAGT